MHMSVQDHLAIKEGENSQSWNMHLKNKSAMTAAIFLLMQGSFKILLFFLKQNRIQKNTLVPTVQCP